MVNGALVGELIKVMRDKNNNVTSRIEELHVGQSTSYQKESYKLFELGSDGNLYLSRFALHEPDGYRELAWFQYTEQGDIEYIGQQVACGDGSAGTMYNNLVKKEVTIFPSTCKVSPSNPTSK
jgi:hypothetical protein